ncbi:hypothetical protein [Agrobacterium salinitolerans]|uniref:hypothetical protein n=1 Tax=Agrobacterium salinitolerans TaxID=1183413 RepID=UPI001574A885|nr:hypothetical protein [Agrobacterium salinitolerans]NTA40384.1 hypothetical protein [Agrobacterium salinitolerans]
MTMMRMLIFILAFAVSAGHTLAQGVAPVSDRGIAMDELIKVLKDDASRQRFIELLEKSKQPKSEPAAISGQSPEEQPVDEADANSVFQGGLMTGVSTWFADLGERLPSAALGAPIDVKLAQAEAQIGTRLSPPGAVEKLQDFGFRSAFGWLSSQRRH